MTTKLLTPEEWADIVPPFSHMIVKNAAWGKVHRDMIGKWLEAHCGGWVYYDGDETYVFGRPGDHMMFKMWISSDPFANEDGEIEAP